MKSNTILYIANNPTHKDFLYTKELLPCDACGNSTENGGYYFEGYSRYQPPLRLVLCGACHRETKHHPKGYDVLQKKILVGGFIPDGASVWVSSPPSLVSAKNLDVFSVADRQQGHESVVDNTVISGKDSALLGSPEHVFIGKPVSEVRDSSIDLSDSLYLTFTAEPIEDDGVADDLGVTRQ